MLSIEVKLALFDSQSQEASQASIANMHGVRKSIISHLKKNEYKLRGFAVGNGESRSERWQKDPASG